jgi:predicted HTH domain antitoxin
MAIAFTLPERIEEHLRSTIGPNLGDAAREAMAVELYREGKLSLGQVAEMLGLSTYQADGVLKRHGAEQPYTVADFEADARAANQHRLPLLREEEAPH